MKKIITAINNPKLNEELKKENNFKIIGKDILYKEAILEILEKNKNIDIIIISEKILGEINFEYLIKKIKLINEKIKIIFILEKENNYLEKILKENNINDIYYNNKINLFELIKIINKKEINMEEEIIKLKKIIKENKINYNKLKNNYEEKNEKIENKINNNKIIKNKSNNKNKKERIEEKNNFFKKRDERDKKDNKYLVDKIEIKKPLKREKKENDNKNKSRVMLNRIITISGNSKSGKTSLTLIISQYLSKKNYKVLLVDADFKKQDLSFILKREFRRDIKLNNAKLKYKYCNLRKNQYKRKNSNKKFYDSKINKNGYNTDYISKNPVQRVNNNIYFLSEEKTWLEKNEEKNNQILEKKIQKTVNINKQKYDFIIFDLAKENLDIINRQIIKNSDKNIVLMEANILGIKEIKQILNLYVEEWKISKNSLHIVSNKNNITSINVRLISKILSVKNSIIKIQENKKFLFCMNSYSKINKLLKNKNIKKEINKIVELIL